MEKIENKLWENEEVFQWHDNKKCIKMHKKNW